VTVTVAQRPGSGGTPDPGLAPARLARTKRRRHRLLVLGLMAPAIIGFAVFFVYPLLATVYFSFTRYDLITPPQFVGLRNYRFFFFEDPNSWKSVRNTLWFVAFMVPARIVFALLIAQMLTKIRRAGGLFRTIFFLPALTPPVAATIAFAFLFNPGTGMVNRALAWFGIDGPLWLNDPQWSKPVLLALGVWGLGDIMIIFLAALLDVPTEQYEAASIDGANAFQQFRYITLPTISPVLLFGAVTGVIQMLQYFTQAVVASSLASGQATVGGGQQLTLGYPNGSTLTYPLWMYQMGFKNFFLGYAAAMAAMLFVVAMAFTAFLLRRSAAFVYGAEGTR
jgi:multiple sugar transport system permease protein